MIPAPATSLAHDRRCRGCFLPPVACLCPKVPIIPTRTRFFIVRHIREAKKTTNTGRLAAKALPSAILSDYGRPHDLVRPPADLSRAWLLYPDGDPSTEVDVPEWIVVLDGTWHQTRRMVQRIPWLRGIRRVSLSPRVPADGLRREPNPVAMPTLTAIARAIEQIEGPRQAVLLDALHEEFTRRVRALGGIPRRTP